MGSKNFTIWFRSSTQALLEISLMLLPIIIWGIALHSIGKGSSLNLKNPVTTFFALSLWLSTLRDGLKTFNRDSEEGDRFQREIITIYSLIGVILTSVLLTLSVAHSAESERYILSFHSTYNTIMICAGAASAWLIKTILIQRKDYGTYYS